jgi:glutamate-ammonia-ligase adenylyltransferase
LIAACRDSGLLDESQAQRLTDAHAELLRRALACTLDLRPRIAPSDATLEHLAADVHDVTAQLGFAF